MLETIKIFISFFALSFLLFIFIKMVMGKKETNNMEQITKSEDNVVKKEEMKCEKYRHTSSSHKVLGINVYAHDYRDVRLNEEGLHAILKDFTDYYKKEFKEFTANNK